MDGELATRQLTRFMLLLDDESTSVLIIESKHIVIRFRFWRQIRAAAPVTRSLSPRAKALPRDGHADEAPQSLW